MVLDSSDSKPSVFDRLAEDISKHNEKAAVHRASGDSNISVEDTKITLKSRNHCQSLTKSKLGQAILYGHSTHQRHLETKLANIERQKIQSIRNMEWKQLDMFRMLANDKLQDLKEKDKITAIYQSSIERQRRKLDAEQLKSSFTHFPKISQTGSLVCNENNTLSRQKRNASK